MPIPSISGGTVVQVYKNNKTAGNGVVVKTADGTLIRYLHMQHTPPVKVGQKVNAGTNLGKIGSTGRSTGPHLHLQAVKNGKNVDPMKYMGSGGSTPRQGRQPEGSHNARKSGGSSSYKPSYTNRWKTEKEASKSPGYKSYKNHLINAVNNGMVPAKDAVSLTELIGRESSWNAGAANPKSTARGYGQFLSATRKQYEKKMKMSYSVPVNQIAMTYQYAIDRYGSVDKALKHWDKHNWY